MDGNTKSAVGFSIFIFFGLYRYFTNLFLSEKQKILLLNSSRMSSIGVMASSIAHEVNNPLSIVSGKAMQIVSMIDRQDEVDILKIKANALKINEVSFRIGKIVQGLKLISRDARDEEMTTVLISKVIEDALSLTSETMKNEGISLNVKIESDILIVCRATQLSQVVLSLLNNSLNGVKPLDEKWILIEARIAENGILQISVSDSRVGISQEIIDEIEGSFIPTNNNLSFDLRVVKTIIEGHSGRLSIDKSCANTKFIIDLPIVKY